jgi:hypothetical protein
MPHHPLFTSSGELVVVLRGQLKLLEFFAEVDRDPLLLAEVPEALSEDVAEAGVDVNISLVGTPPCSGSSLVEMSRCLTGVPCDWGRILAGSA